MDSLRAEPPAGFGELAVEAAIDLETGSPDLPPTDGLKYLLGGAEGVADARVIVRPSGTEPKVKAYLEVRAPVGSGRCGSGQVAGRREAGCPGRGGSDTAVLVSPVPAGLRGIALGRPRAR